MTMSFGITIPHFGRTAEPGLVEAAAREAEELGFESVWASDHVIVPTGEGYVPSYFYDPLMVMAVAATVTERIRVGASVLVIPYREPVITAKMLATLDQMCGGRVIVGVGVGWLEAEFEALGADFHERGPMTDEYLDCMHALWTTDPTTFHGRWTRFTEMRQNPEPAQDPFPVWVGGNSVSAIRRAAARGTGWHPINLTLEQFRAGIEAYRAACEEAGKPAGEVCLRSMPGEQTQAGGRAPFTGAAGEVAGDIDEYAKVGLTHIVFSPAVSDRTGYEREMRFIADEVRPLVGVA